MARVFYPANSLLPLLAMLSAGTALDLDQLVSVAYEDLKRMAAAVKRGDPQQTLNPTALVNEAYLRLAASPNFCPLSRQHLKRAAARAMRQVLVDAARRRKALKRGGGRHQITFDEEVIPADATPDDVLALHAALDELARLDERQARVVEYRYFGGFDIAETAALLSVSEATVSRDWRLARAWLACQMRHASTS